MSVETRFVVIRNNEEVKVFMDKKSADEYDKMLEIADGISELLSQSPITLTDDDNEALSVFLSQHKETLLIALQAKKAKAVPKKVKKLTQEEKVDDISIVENACPA